MLTKSEKLKADVEGVVGLKMEEKKPGVDIIDDGSGVDFPGGVEGGYCSFLLPWTAGEGDAARYNNRSAPSLPA